MNEMNNTRQPLSFGKTLLASSLGVIIAGTVLSFVGFIIMIGMMVSMLSGVGGDENTAVLQSDTYLKIDMTRPVQEQAPSSLESMFGEGTSLGADQLLAGIEAARDDDNVKGLYVTVGGTSGLGWGLAEEIRNALISFRESGKDVIFYGESYSQPEYYVASVASRIFLHTDGMVDFRGMGAQLMYYKDLFDKLGVKVDLIRPESCAYKSAGETYTMNHMSEANREQIRQYIGSIWSHVSGEICQWRKLGDVKVVNEMADNLTAYLAGDARRSGLVDSLCYANDVVKMIRDNAKHIVPLSKYAPSQRMPYATNVNSSDCIAVVYASGSVEAGKYKGMGDGIYSERTVEAIAKAANNDKVKAIVLRVNSPGGAATTSQSITDAVRRAREKKPVVVSMSDYAASAGYEMSCLANCIVAQPTTVTGSIGVFGTIPQVGDMLRKKIGITFDTVKTNRNSAGLSLVTPLSPAARAMMQRNVEEFYKVFVSTVAEGRGKTYAEIDAIARGRVWTGKDAIQIGLVDTLGGLRDAVAIAARLAGITDYNTLRYPAQQTWSEQLSTILNGDESEVDRITLKSFWLAKREAGRMQQLSLLEQIEQDMLSLAKEPSLQARMPYLLFLD